MFEEAGERAAVGGVPAGGVSLPAGVSPRVALDGPTERGAAAFEAVPREPAARVAWLCEELSRLGRRVAAGDVAVPGPAEPGAEGELSGEDGPLDDSPPSARVSPVLEVAPVDGVRVDVIALLERVKSVAAAAQARVTTAFAASQEAAALRELGVTPEPEQQPDSTPEPTPERTPERTPTGTRGATQDERARRRRRAERLARSSVVGQVGLARRISPARAAACVAAAKAWTSDLPTTLAALDVGDVSEWGAEIVARETATLTPELRRRVDEQVGAGLRCWSERQIRAAVVARGYALDPQAAVKRHEKAVGERRVSTRPAADGMVWLSALLPVVQGISCQASLSAAADAAKAAGDGRGTGQLMADLLVQAVTGQSARTPDLPTWVTDPIHWDAGAASAPADDADAGAERIGLGPDGTRTGRRDTAPPGPPAVPVEVQVVVSAEALWGDPDDPGYDQPAMVPGYGPLPAWLARHLVRDTPDPHEPDTREPDTHELDTHEADTREGHAHDVGSRAATFLRRLWACPDTGVLVALESRRRVFDGGLRRFLIARDQTCRTPFCDAPIRQLDHVAPHADGGPTSARNGQGLCTRCNQTKEAPGWAATPVEVPDRSAATMTDPPAPSTVRPAMAAARPATVTAPRPAQEPRRDRIAPGHHQVRLTTPTGRTYLSSAPPLLPTRPPAPDVDGTTATDPATPATPYVSVVEQYLRDLLSAA